jgi:predicted RNA methylase
MARLMCEAKLAYYPTDPKTLRNVIDRFLRFPSSASSDKSSAKKASVLDPCCATGKAVSAFRSISETLSVSLYGIEIDEQRAKEASKSLDRLLNADAIWGVRRSNDWAGVLFLNPPYGLTADKERVELAFVGRYAQTVVKGGVMILVINPSSLDEAMAKALVSSGYKPIVSVFDPDNEDYKNYKQFFIVLQRIDKKYRFGSANDMLEAIISPIPIDQAQTEPIDVAAGIAPSLFKEIETPEWRIDEMILKSRLNKRFNILLESALTGGSSIETPNEGQAALLLASGVLNRPIGDWLLKGQVLKVLKETTEYDEETGKPIGLKVRDEYKTVIYGLNTKNLKFARFE